LDLGSLEFAVMADKGGMRRPKARPKDMERPLTYREMVSSRLREGMGEPVEEMVTRAPRGRDAVSFTRSESKVRGFKSGGMVTTFGAGEPPASPASGRQQVSGKGFRGTF
jgi:hypothetical protein